MRMKKRFLLIIVGVFLIVTSKEKKAFAEELINANEYKWMNIEEGWTLVNSSGERATGVVERNGYTYYLDTNGVMRTGWNYINDKYMYFYPGGNRDDCRVGWQQINGKWYFIKDDYSVARGVLERNGYTYLLDDNGVMRTGWQVVDGKWLYFYSGGNQNKNKKGWQQINSKWYFIKDDYSVAKGVLERNGYTYLLDDNGVMQTGWQVIDGKWLYFYPGGNQNKNAKGWQQINNKWYYIKSDYSLATGMLELHGYKYLLDSNGVMQTGWHVVDGKYMYFYSGGNAATGWLNINGTYYLLDKNGFMLKGWQKVNNSWYYLKSDGRMATGWLYVNSHYYYLYDGGNMATGWVFVNSHWYYLANPGGDMLTGWIHYNGSDYYLDESGAMRSGVQRINNKLYIIGDNGNVIHNAVGIDVSKHQGDINWDAVVNSVNFAIIKCFGLAGEEVNYHKNITGAKSKGIPVGVYVYSYATNCNEAAQEAYSAIELVRREGGVNLPIYIDIEDPGAQGNLSQREITDIANTFCRIVANAGYIPGVYANQNWFRNKMYVNELDSNISVWCARYNDKGWQPDINHPVDIWQHSSGGSVPGINGRVDMNVFLN